jgi:hypothetical protein
MTHSQPLSVLINTDVPSSVLMRIRDISARLTVVTESEFQALPSLLSEADVLFTHLARFMFSNARRQCGVQPMLLRR